MDKQTEELAKELRDAIGKGRQYDRTDILGMFMECENIIGILAYLISPLTKFEQEYRTKIVNYMEQGDSHAKAQEKARISDAYVNYRNLDMLCKLGDDKVKILKKFKDNLEMEYKRT